MDSPEKAVSSGSLKILLYIKIPFEQNKAKWEKNCIIPNINLSGDIENIILIYLCNILKLTIKIITITQSVRLPPQHGILHHKITRDAVVFKNKYKKSDIIKWKRAVNKYYNIIKAEGVLSQFFLLFSFRSLSFESYDFCNLSKILSMKP